MSDKSKISWTDATWNCVRGCTKVSPGCKHCYAETFAERWRGVPGHPYEQGFDLRLVPEKFDQPLRWKRPRRIFVNSMSDLFQDGVPDEYIDKVFAVMALADQHTFQVLTKRADRMREYLSRHDVGLRWAQATRQWSGGKIYAPADAVKWSRDGLPNCWLGVSVENQECADERIPLLLQTPAAVRFLSVEPLLGPVDFSLLPHDNEEVGGALDGLTGNYWIEDLDGAPDAKPAACRRTRTVVGQCGSRIHWVIVGGESGPGARPMSEDWVRLVRDQCTAAGVAFFYKQRLDSRGRKQELPELDGAQWAQFPQFLERQRL